LGPQNYNETNLGGVVSAYIHNIKKLDITIWGCTKIVLKRDWWEMESVYVVL